MCGRFTLRASPRLVEEAIGLYAGLDDFKPRFNIAPTQSILVLHHREGEEKPRYSRMRWGLVPSWAGDVSNGNRLLNARSDGVATKPSFRSAFKRRRCLVIADGFYEWKAGETKKTPKQPFHMHRPDNRPFAFAGLWEHWEKGETPVESCTIITTDANGFMQPLHNRMPVILGAADYGKWMDPAVQEPGLVLPLLMPCPDDWLAMRPVSTVVNNARNETPECLNEPAA